MLHSGLIRKRLMNVVRRRLFSSSSSAADRSIPSDPISDSVETSSSAPSLIRKLKEENRMLPIKLTGPDTELVIRKSREEVAAQIAAGAKPRMPFRLWRLIFAKCNPYTMQQYVTLTKEERIVNGANWRAMQERRLTYKDPYTGFEVMTTAALLLQGRCCGNGCRHCPYDHENASEDVKKVKKWNGAYYV